MRNLDAMTPAQLRAALGYERNFARVLSADDGRVAFAYDLDPERWPWLALPPLHPVVIDKIQYFSAVTAILATSRLEPGTRSALTKIGWSTAPRAGGARHAVRGELGFASGERPGYRLAVFDADGHENARIWGEGAAFADRDFGAWRARAKRTAREAAGAAAAPPPPADPVAVGLGPGGRCLVSKPFERDGALALAALVTAANGFHPAHPFHTGSGDHVNAAHLFDCALQAAHLLAEPAGARLACTDGEAEFLRFVELDTPFELRLEAREPLAHGRTRMRFAIGQAGRENARVRFDLAREASLAEPA